MSLKLTKVAVLGVFALALIGCNSNASRCEDFCELLDDCGSDVNCSDSHIDDCADELDDADDSCIDSLDEFLDCANDQDLDCEDTANDCDSELEDVADDCDDVEVEF